MPVWTHTNPRRPKVLDILLRVVAESESTLKNGCPGLFTGFLFIWEHILKNVLFLLAILALLSGVGIFASAKSAIHEIEGFLLFTIAAILASGAVVTDAVDSLKAKIEKEPARKSPMA